MCTKNEGAEISTYALYHKQITHFETLIWNPYWSQIYKSALTQM